MVVKGITIGLESWLRSQIQISDHKIFFINLITIKFITMLSLLNLQLRLIMHESPWRKDISTGICEK